MTDNRIEKTYSWSTDEEQYHGSYPSIEAAIADAEAEHEEDWTGPVWVGEQAAPVQPEEHWDAERWLEHVSCQDEYSSEWAEDWDTSTKEQREELEYAVRKVMAEWLDRHCLRPTFWLIEKAKKYIKAGEKWGPQP